MCIKISCRIWRGLRTLNFFLPPPKIGERAMTRTQGSRPPFRRRRWCAFWCSGRCTTFRMSRWSILRGRDGGHSPPAAARRPFRPIQRLISSFITTIIGVSPVRVHLSRNSLGHYTRSAEPELRVRLATAPARVRETLVPRCGASQRSCGRAILPSS